jgi:hypothetical protein
MYDVYGCHHGDHDGCCLLEFFFFVGYFATLPLSGNSHELERIRKEVFVT